MYLFANAIFCPCAGTHFCLRYCFSTWKHKTLDATSAPWSSVTLVRECRVGAGGREGTEWGRGAGKGGPPGNPVSQGKESHSEAGIREYYLPPCRAVSAVTGLSPQDAGRSPWACISWKGHWPYASGSPSSTQPQTWLLLSWLRGSCVDPCKNVQQNSKEGGKQKPNPKPQFKLCPANSSLEESGGISGMFSECCSERGGGDMDLPLFYFHDVKYVPSR